MAAKWFTCQLQDMALHLLNQCLDLFRRAKLKLSLDKEIPESVCHQFICLLQCRLEDELFLFCGGAFQFLLHENRCLLVCFLCDTIYEQLVDTCELLRDSVQVVATYAPVDIDILVEHTAIFNCVWIDLSLGRRVV